MDEGKVLVNVDWKKLSLILAVLIGVVLRIWSCSEAFGIWWKGDEAEYVNMAWLMIRGYGWPSLDLRSPFYPLLLSFPIKTAELLGIEGNGVMQMCRFFNMSFSVLLVFSTYALAKELYSEKVANLTAILLSFSAPLIEWTPRVMTEIPATSFLVLGLAVAIYAIRRNSLRLVLISGCLLGCSYLIRFPYAVFLIPLAIYLLFIEKKRCLTCGLLFGFLLVFLFGGVLDYMIWGSFLHASERFFMINVVTKCEHTQLNLLYYVRNAAWYVTPVGIVVGPLGLRKNRPTVFILGLIGSYLAMISLTPNYDLRYGLALVPFVLVFVANGLVTINDYLKRFLVGLSAFSKHTMKLLTILIPIVIICLSVVQTLNAQFVYNEKATKAALYLNNQSDIKGLITVGYACKMGEYIYLQKNVPIYEYTTQNCSVLESLCENSNYVIVINDWYLQSNPSAIETIVNYGFTEIVRYEDVFVLKK